jgi:hypothetical protein
MVGRAANKVFTVDQHGDDRPVLPPVFADVEPQLESLGVFYASDDANCGCSASSRR